MGPSFEGWRWLDILAHGEVIGGDELPAAQRRPNDRAQQRGRKLGAGCLVFALAGCRSLVDADHYNVSEGGAAGETPVDVLAWTTPACTECAAEECRDLLSACERDAACVTASGCSAEEASPAQRLRCALRHPEGQLPHTALLRCLSTECAATCRGETSWSCLSQDGLVTEPATGPVRLSATYLNVLNGDPLPGLTVRVCETGSSEAPCARELDRAETDELGTASLMVNDVADVDPSFLAATGEGLYPELRFRSTPILVDTAVRHSGVTLEARDLISAASGAPEVEGHGSLSVTMYDCVGVPAPGVAIEVEPTDDWTKRFYSKGQLALDATLEETQADGITVIANVPAGLVTVRAVLVATGEAINEQQVIVSGGHRSTLAFEPRVSRP